MTTQVQFRRGSTAEHDAFTGQVGEVTVDTDKGVAVAHDAVTLGGHPMMREGVHTVADLRAIRTRPAFMVAAGGLATGDGGGGCYRWDPLSTDPDDGADVIEPMTGGTGRWVRYSTWITADPVTQDQLGVANGVATLNAQGKLLAAQIPDALVGALAYQGTWDAATNTPAIPVAGGGNHGHYYVVGVAGTTDIDGETDWEVGDWLVSNGTSWDKIDNTEPPASGIVNDSSVTGATVGAALEALDADIGTLQTDVAGREAVGQLAGSPKITTASADLLDSHAGTRIRMSSATAQTINIKAQVDEAYRTDFWAVISQTGDGVTTVQAPAGVTLNGVDGGSVALPHKAASVTLHRVSDEGDDVWEINLEGVS
ncbi:hypothetical protein HW532_15745 [Kaustia mangrovi]|uniref:Major tropism determinant N-terminal domain-containing protein n=1 Tax=Kaustia mangrovi TaxID=2593653 RepID=A0A7S8C5Y4_9HYPH|nr:hypothetical protein [Kaustia mangrovi]QPC44015.1 hypothetical protein HW532_15745 [Kaustia mangrovi]